jgi:hypothetical protein
MPSACCCWRRPQQRARRATFPIASFASWQHISNIRFEQRVLVAASTAGLLARFFGSRSPGKARPFSFGIVFKRRTMLRASLFASIGVALLLGGQPALTGRVVADTSGDPIANARVRIVVAGARTQLLVTDADGRFSAPGPLSRAIDRVGEPIVNGTVIVQTADGRRSIARTATDDSGRFRVPGIPTGRVVVSLLTASVVPVRQMLPNGNTVIMAEQARTYFPGTFESADADVIALESGEEHAGVDFVVDADQVGAGTIVFGGPLSPNTGTTSGPYGMIRGRDRRGGRRAAGRPHRLDGGDRSGGATSRPGRRARPIRDRGCPGWRLPCRGVEARLRTSAPI